MIISAPENVTVPLGQTTPVNFSCHASGDVVLWVINGTIEHQHDANNLKNRGITIYNAVANSSEIYASMSVDVMTARNNNTEIHCIAVVYMGPPPENSTTVTLTIAGKVLITITKKLTNGEQICISI